MKRYFTYRLSPFQLTAVAFALIMFYACSPNTDQTAEEEYKKEYFHTLYRLWRNEDSMQIMLQKSIREKDNIGEMLCYKQLGKYQRENARFSEAIASHQAGLDLALKLNDTLEIVQALNNLGTDFRRIGALSEASGYHFDALSYAEAYSQQHESFDGLKNKVVALNGIGNISLSMGYYDEAENFFRNALKDEILLKSAIGQAINFANLGAIFEHRQQYDSARAYYEYSMEQNKKAKSDMGIGLCYIHFGDLYTIEQNYELAKAEYMKAYDLMEDISDRWHWLVACLSIAKINFLTHDTGEFNKYIALAEQTAKEINSAEHLARVYSLKHEYHLKNGNYSTALSNYKQSIAMLDSVQGIQRNNQYMEMRVNYERESNQRNIRQLEAANQAKNEQKQRSINFLVFVFFLGSIATALLYYGYRQRTRSNKLLVQLDRMRSDFFTNITHEFRTPLTVILGMAERIKERNGFASEAKTIERQGNTLLDMINQLLDMAKIQSNGDQSKWLHGDAAACVNMTVETYRDYAASRGVDLIFNSEKQSIPIDFIPDYFNKIVRNLLSNALKFTPKGGIVTVSTQQNKNNFILSVADTGSGIDPADLPHIFKQFYQGKSMFSENGTGIGLAFVSKMAESMNGSVTAANRKEGGARFTVTLPLKQKFEVKELWNPFENCNSRTILLSQKEENHVSEDCEDAGEEMPSILVIEDNRDIRHYIGSLLRDRYQIRYAANGQEGLEKAKEFMPDLIITDLMMPVMDGYKVCCSVRENDILNHIPIVVITAKATGEDKQRAFECGADAYLYKPFNATELNIRVDKLLEQRRLLREKYSSAIFEDASENVELSAADRKFLNRLTTIIYERITDTGLNPDYVAEKMYMSRSQLNRKLRNITGYSVAAYVLQVRLEKAKRLLITHETPIGEIAIQSGFDDSNYFSRVFRKVYEVTPSQYRKNVEAIDN